MFNQQSMTLISSTENLQKVREFVADSARIAGFGDDDVYKMELAVDEACTNVIKHAYRNDHSKEIDIQLLTENDKFIIVIEDSGIEFRESEYHEPVLAESVKLRKRGGLGIHLIKSFMDEVKFQRLGNKNILQMTKLINK